ncbi:N-terminal kinase-like protein [Lepeophtheirus salmonis]|uniref:N-terminal kinase-like protein n=1 Tax=Lepeophtheirus salmonis TaxID=72036 RepID=UPI001AE2E126|nr:N-terminal kinase-like protein [Lepeophtheirus salmonis]
MVWSFFSQNLGSQFPYSYPEEVGADCLRDLNVFRLYNGESNKGEEVSVFICENPAYMSYAKAAVQRLKTLKHPSILTYLESFESDKGIYLATERVTPLLLHLEKDLISYPEITRNQYIAYGIYALTKALSFMESEAKLKHNNIHSASVFVNSAGDWKLGGLEYVTPLSEKNPPTRIFSALSKYDPPEMGKMDQSTNTSLDAWGFGCLIWEMFNGSLGSTKNLSRLGHIPKDLCSSYMELVASNPRKRPSPKVLHSRLKNSYFKNDIIDTVSFLEELQIQEEDEKLVFYNNLPSKIDNIPVHICNRKILPHLINAFEFGNAGCTILNPLFKIGKYLSPEEFQAKIVPCVIKLFSSPDRNARFKLLSQIEHFIEHLSPKIINNQVFSQIQNGFIDREPIIREKTVISIIHLAPKLNFSNLDDKVVLMNFSRLLRDEVPGIRTNTTVCLGKIAPHLSNATRQKVLIGAFSSKLKDPFPPARIAALNALVATQEYYTLQEVALRILPVICHKMIDPDKSVRDQAFKVTRNFMEKLENNSENPDFKRIMEKEMENNTVVSAATDWASWAVGTLGAKFSKPSTDATKNNENKSSPPSVLSVEKIRPIPVEKPSSIQKDVNLIKDDVSTNDPNDGWDDDEWRDFDDESPTTELDFKSSSTVLQDNKVLNPTMRTPISHSAFSNNDIVVEDDSDWGVSSDGWESFDPLAEVSNTNGRSKKKGHSSKAGPLKLGAKNH